MASAKNVIPNFSLNFVLNRINKAGTKAEAFKAEQYGFSLYKKGIIDPAGLHQIVKAFNIKIKKVE